MLTAERVSQAAGGGKPRGRVGRLLVAASSVVVISAATVQVATAAPARATIERYQALIREHRATEARLTALTRAHRRQGDRLARTQADLASALADVRALREIVDRPPEPPPACPTPTVVAVDAATQIASMTPQQVFALMPTIYSRFPGGSILTNPYRATVYRSGSYVSYDFTYSP